MSPEVIGLKPARGPSGSWIGHLPRERRTALVALFTLLCLLGVLVAYQRATSHYQPAPLPYTDPETPEGGAVGNQAVPPGGGQPVAAEQDPTVAAIEPVVAPTHLLKPLAGQRAVLQPYAMTYSEAYGDFRFSGGVSYGASVGDTVLAAAAGNVVTIEDDPADGRRLVVDHGGGLLTRYAGLGQVTVALNATVQPGDSIGQVGAPGPARAAVGTHLYFQVLRNGDPVDPDSYLSN